MRFTTHIHLRFHLNSGIVHTISSNLNAVLDMGARSSISFLRCFAGTYLWTLVLWERLSRKPGLQGSSPSSFCHHHSESTRPRWGLLSVAYYSFISINLNNHLVTRGNSLLLVMGYWKNDAVILFTSWVLTDVPHNKSLVLCTIYHPQILLYVDLKWCLNKNMSHENYPDFQFCRNENCGLNIIRGLHFSTDVNIRLMD